MGPRIIIRAIAYIVGVKHHAISDILAIWTCCDIKLVVTLDEDLLTISSPIGWVEPIRSTYYISDPNITSNIKELIDGYTKLSSFIDR